MCKLVTSSRKYAVLLRTQRPQLGGDVLEFAQALGNSVGYNIDLVSAARCGSRLGSLRWESIPRTSLLLLLNHIVRLDMSRQKRAIAGAGEALTGTGLLRARVGLNICMAMALAGCMRRALVACICITRVANIVTRGRSRVWAMSLSYEWVACGLRRLFSAKFEVIILPRRPRKSG